MTTDTYYEEELRYLRSEGARFASRYPQRARYLNLDSAKDTHPRIERLLEGFAFLCANIRRRLDDSFPELTAGLAEALWPQLLEPVPGICVVEFKPRPGMLQAAYIIRKGTELYTAPDPASGAACRFSTASGVAVNPIALDSAGCVTEASGKDVLTLRFRISPGVRRESLRLSPLRVYIHNDLASALAIRKMLLCHAESVTLSGDGGRAVSLDPRKTFVEGGFGEDDNLFPEYQSVSRPLGMIRDYFTFPERFLFVDIAGLDKLERGGKPPSALSLEIRFDRKEFGMAALTKANLKLHCAPAVNVFRRDAEPVAVSGKKCEYPVRADYSHPGFYTVQSVESVTGINSATGERREYGRYGLPGVKRDAAQRYYSLRRDRQPGGETEILLSMNGRQTENGRLIRETLHIETWQSNGAAARKAAAGGGLCKVAPDFPEFITFANITVPNAPVNPPPDDAYLWAFVSHLACAHTDFSDAGKLKDFLYAYDWTGMGPGAGGQKKRPEIEAIRSVAQRPIDMTAGRAVIRGTETVITIDGNAAPEETLFLFGTVLARALSCMSPINTFLKLVFLMTPSGERFEWRCRSGERI